MVRLTNRKKCLVTSCERLSFARGCCGKHYDKLRKYGDPNYVKENTTRFKKGFTPWNKGTKGLCKPNSGSFKAGEVKNEKHPQWKGEKPGYFAVHYWIRRNWEKPHKCEHCWTTNSKRYEWANISGEYTRSRSDWIVLCTLCHHIYDGIYQTNTGDIK